jgi:opacity protein-like surface antigen
MVKKFAACLAIALMTAAVSATAQQQPAKAAATAPAAAPKAAGEDRYIGYYYPKPTATETFESSMQTIAGAERAQRIQFVTVVSQGTIQSAYRVPYAVFAKGEKADRLIIVGLQQGELNTIYRMRALLANMTTMSRLSPFFQERTVAEDATFFDLLKLLGFREVTITDGEKATLQVTIK